MGARRALAMLAVCASACGAEPTQTVVCIDADPGVRARATRLHIEVRDAAGTVRHTSDAALEGASPDIWLPARVPLVPDGGDASRRYDITAELVGADDTTFARVRARGGFADGALLVVSLRFDDSCADKLDCGEGETCGGGVCLPADVSGATVTGERTLESACGARAGPRFDQIGLSTYELFWRDPAASAPDVDGMAELGPYWGRTELEWRGIEATMGNYDWTTADALIDGHAVRGGMHMLVVLSHAPAWANGAGGDDAPPVDIGPDGSPSFDAFVRVVVDRYKDRVQAWEIYNEQNIAGFWNPPDPTGYAHLLRGAYAAVKEVDPSATVVVGGLAAAGTYESDPVRNPVRFVEAMYLAGAQGSFDAIGIHPGGNTLPSTVSIPTTWYQLHGDALDGGMVGDPPTPSLRRLMIDHGDEDKEIWLTHFGRTTVGTGSIDEAAQALTVRDAYFTWSTYPWAGPLFWFAYRDEGGDTTQSYLWFGLVHQDRTHKPAWDAYSELARATRAWRSP